MPRQVAVSSSPRLHVPSGDPERCACRTARRIRGKGGESGQLRISAAHIEPQLTPKKHPDTISSTAATSVIHSAAPSSALPPTALLSMRFLATMKRPKSNAKAMSAVVAPNEAKTVVKQVPWNPRI